jgi:hypothetical protein
VEELNLWKFAQGRSEKRIYPWILFTRFGNAEKHKQESVPESLDIRGNTHKKTSAEECWVQIRKCEGLKCWEVLEGSLRRDSKELRLGCVSRRRDLDRE